MNDFTETPRAAEGGPRVGLCTHGRPRRKKRALSVSVLMETSNCALGRRLAVLDTTPALFWQIAVNSQMLRGGRG